MEAVNNLLSGTQRHKMELKTNIVWEGVSTEITVKSMTYGDFKEARRKSIIYKYVDGKTLPMRDLELYDEICVLKSLSKAPFDINLDNIRKFSKADGEKIEELINKLNQPENDS